LVSNLSLSLILFMLKLPSNAKPFLAQEHMGEITELQLFSPNAFDINFFVIHILSLDIINKQNKKKT